MRLKIAIGAVLLGFSCGTVLSAPVVYEYRRLLGTPGSNTWSNPLNWVGGIVPSSSQDATIQNDPSNTPGSWVNDLPASLEVDTLRISRNLTGNPIGVSGSVVALAQNSVGGVRPIGQIHMNSSIAPSTSDVSTAGINGGGLIGNGGVDLAGSWSLGLTNFTGSINVPRNALLQASGTTQLSSLDVRGTLDVVGTIGLSGGGPIDIKSAVLDMGRSYTGGVVSRSVTSNFTGDLILGDWAIRGEGPSNAPNDRLNVSGTLDLRESRLIAEASAGTTSISPISADYLVLATYGNRLGQIDATTLQFRGFFAATQSFQTRRLRIVYTSAENAGPGEIRALLPEPSILLTVVATGLLVRRRREE